MLVQILQRSERREAARVDDGCLYALRSALLSNFLLAEAPGALPASSAGIATWCLPKPAVRLEEALQQ